VVVDEGEELALESRIVTFERGDEDPVQGPSGGVGALDGVHVGGWLQLR
jgi:hypothetical protein